MTAFTPLAGGRRALMFLFLLVVLVSLVEPYSGEEKPGIIGLHQSAIEHGGNGEKPPCTVDDLMPDYELEDDLSLNWMQNHLAQPPFDCACRTLKARWEKGEGRGQDLRSCNISCVLRSKFYSKLEMVSRKENRGRRRGQCRFLSMQVSMPSLLRCGLGMKYPPCLRLWCVGEQDISCTIHRLDAVSYELKKTSLFPCYPR